MNQEDQIKCDLAPFSLKIEYDSGCAHHMTGDKSKMGSLMKKHHGNDVLSQYINIIDSGGVESVKHQFSNSHTQLL